MPHILWEIDDKKRVFLTFDDGPTPGITEFILDTLAQYNAKATFFCLGKNAEQYPELTKKILAAGHKLGNHTTNHLKGWKVTGEEYSEDIAHTERIFHSEFFRPPYGRVGLRKIRMVARKYRIVLWTVISQDYARQYTPEQCLRKVTRFVKPGHIVVFHDSWKAWKNMSYALPRTLEYIYSKGYTCDVID